ncbi:hypothetical protein [Flavobacterium noncentrifugens]|nr:hypothetical protein [Flavobacterium noncentrifugens]
MKWNAEPHRRGNGQQEIQVSILVKEMQVTFASDSETWINQFKDRLRAIPRKNCFSAEFGYTASAIDLRTLEVWKVKANGDNNYKMFTVTLIGKNDSDRL